PRYQAGTVPGSARAATRRVLLEVGDECGDLLVRPAGADCGHLANAVSDEDCERCGVGERRRAGVARADAAFAVQPVALAAGALPLLLAEVERAGVLGRAALLQPGVELGLRHDPHRREHPCVLEAAELRALA